MRTGDIYSRILLCVYDNIAAGGCYLQNAFAALNRVEVTLYSATGADFKLESAAGGKRKLDILILRIDRSSTGKTDCIKRKCA